MHVWKQHVFSHWHHLTQFFLSKNACSGWVSTHW